MTLEQFITALLGTAFGLRALDATKPAWARIAYGAVGVDLWRTALAAQPQLQFFGPSGAQRTGLTPTSGKLPKFEERKARTITERVSMVHEQAVKGTRDPAVYQLAREVLSRKCGDDWCIAERDALGEVRALFDEVKKRVRYTWDPTDYDAFQTPKKTLELKTGDCIPEDALVVTGGYKLKPIGEVVEGDVVMGNGRWTKVSKFWEKGKKKLLAFDLNNGCVLRCTQNHRVFVVAKDGTVREKRAGQVRVGEMLLSPSKLPEGREALGVDRAWLLGAYVADGWPADYRCSISGKDGHPKEEQKRRVQAIAEKEGAPTRWHPRYITINASPLAQWLMSGTGRGAANKQVPSLDVDAVSRDALLEGLQADAAHEGPARNVVYGTTSDTLALQLRLLHRQRGESVSMRYVTKHGGLGDNPIWRVTVRQSTRKPHPKVRAIRELPAMRVVDIETDAHEFYLPEADVIVHNCDDYNSLLAALLRSVGYKVRSRVVQTQGESTWNHIYLLAKVPTTGQWMPLDLSVRQPAGWEVPKNLIVKVQDFDVVEEGGTPLVRS